MFTNTTSIIHLSYNFVTTFSPENFRNHQFTGYLNRNGQKEILEVDVEQQILFFTDAKYNTIYSIIMRGGNTQKEVVKYNGAVAGIAVDYLSQNIYWINQKYGQILVSTYSGSFTKVLVDDTKLPSSITIDPIQRYIFWVHGEFPVYDFERAGLDGSYRKVLMKSLGPITAITADLDSQRLYFANSLTGNIQSIDYHGQSKKIIYEETSGIYGDIDIMKDFIIWTDVSTNSSGLKVFNKETEEFEVFLPFSGSAKGVTVVDPLRQPHGLNGCMNNNGGCEQICVPDNYGDATCLCSTGFLEEEKNCNTNIIDDNFLLLVDKGQRTVYQVDLNAGRNYSYTALYNVPLNHPYWVGFDPVNRHVYVADYSVDKIVRSLLGGQDTEVILEVGYNISGLAIDYISRLLFWSHEEERIIYRSNLNGENIKTLITVGDESDEIQSIAVDPVKGLLFWAEWGFNAKIESSLIDGTSQQVLVSSGIILPTSLALDTEYELIYWCDVFHNKIEKVKYDGSQRTLVKQFADSPVPFKLTLDERYIYYTSIDANTIMRMDKIGLNDPVAIGETTFGHLLGLALYKSKKDCPIRIPNGRTTGCDRYTNSTCLIVCNPGYQTISTNNVTCLPSGEWDGLVELLCVETLCPRLRTPVNTLGDCNRLSKPGHVCGFHCSEGYNRMAGDELRTCLADGRWSGSNLLCQATTCPALVVPEFGVSIQCRRPFVFQSVCSFQCQPGSDQLRGDEVRVCQADGSWSGEDLVCSAVQVRCPELEVLPGVEVVLCSDPVHNAVCIFQCGDGYVKTEGSLHRICQQDGTWSGSTLTCQDTNVEIIFVNIPQNKSVEVGELLTESCSVNDPSADVSWLKEDLVLKEDISIDGVLSLPGGILFISSVAHIHQGVYTCRATDRNNNIIEQSIFIEVTIGDLLTTKPVDVSVNLGDAHAFGCTLSDSSYSIKWEKDGNVILTDEHTQILPNGTLIISDVTVTDTGRYACVVMADGQIRVQEVFASLRLSSVFSNECGTVTSVEAVLEQKTREEVPRIRGGRDAARGSAPWMVRLYHIRKKENFCGGSLLNSQWVITAAHCIAKKNAMRKNTVIRVADYDVFYKDPEEKYYRIQKIIRHKNFSSITYNADIALIKLAKPILNVTDYVRPICLPSSNLTMNIFKRQKLGRVNGWGHLREDVPTPRFLNEVYVPIVRQGKCIESTENIVTSNMFCAGYEREVQDACRGDSGGPFSIPHKGRWYLFGIVSWGEGCGRAGKYGFYTRVPVFIDWINDVTTKG